MKENKDKKVWKQVKIKTDERMSLSIIYYILNVQIRVVKDEY